MGAPSNRTATLESQMIPMIQDVPGQTLRRHLSIRLSEGLSTVSRRDLEHDGYLSYRRAPGQSDRGRTPGDDERATSSGSWKGLIWRGCRGLPSPTQRRVLVLC